MNSTNGRREFFFKKKEKKGRKCHGSLKRTEKTSIPGRLQHNFGAGGGGYLTEKSRGSYNLSKLKGGCEKEGSNSPPLSPGQALTQDRLPGP